MAFQKPRFTAAKPPADWIPPSPTASCAATGEGAALYRGRWNSPGARVVYTSASASLSALETRVHLNPALRFHYLIFPIEFDERFVEKLPPASLPAGWWDEPPPPATKRHLILSSYQVNDWGHEKPPSSFLTGLS